MQGFDLGEGGLGATGHGIGQKVDVLEPHDAAVAKHGDGLDGFAETIHRGLDLGDIGGKPADDLARKLVGHIGGEGIEVIAPGPADEKVVGPADHGKRFRGSGHREQGATTSAIAPRGKRGLGGGWDEMVAKTEF